MNTKLFKFIPNYEYDKNGGCFHSSDYPLEEDTLYLLLNEKDKGSFFEFTVLNVESSEEIHLIGDLAHFNFIDKGALQMDRENLRKVEVLNADRQVKYIAYFHQIYTHTYDTRCFVNAVLELENGEMITESISSIRFIN